MTPPGCVAGAFSAFPPKPATDSGLKASVARIPAGQAAVLRYGCARRGEDEADRELRAVERDGERRADPTALAAGAAGIGFLAPPQGQEQVEELTHLDVRDTFHQDIEQAGVHAVGARARAVPACHRLHQHVEERDGYRPRAGRGRR